MAYSVACSVAYLAAIEVASTWGYSSRVSCPTASVAFAAAASMGASEVPVEVVEVVEDAEVAEVEELALVELVEESMASEEEPIA